jgi:hypothetical protein
MERWRRVGVQELLEVEDLTADVVVCLPAQALTLADECLLLDGEEVDEDPALLTAARRAGCPRVVDGATVADVITNLQQRAISPDTSMKVQALDFFLSNDAFDDRHL